MRSFTLAIGVGASSLCFRSAKPVYGSHLDGDHDSSSCNSNSKYSNSKYSNSNNSSHQTCSTFAVEYRHQSRLQFRSRDRQQTTICMFSVLASVFLTVLFPSSLPWICSAAISFLVFKFSIYFQLLIIICSVVALLISAAKSLDFDTCGFHTRSTPVYQLIYQASLTVAIGSLVLYGLYTHDFIYRSTRSFVFQVITDIILKRVSRSLVLVRFITSSISILVNLLLLIISLSIYIRIN